MKNIIRIGLVATMASAFVAGYGQMPSPQAPGAPGQPSATVPANLSPGAAEVIRLATSGVGDEVVLAYIQNSQAPFNLTADNVLYLKDLGLSAPVTQAMLNHDSTLRGQPGQYAPVATTPAPAPVPAPAVTTPPAVPPPTVAPGPAYIANPPPDVTPFYNDLSPYGTWVYLEGYGWCWQPRAVVVSPGWRPYCDGGYWVYTDAGWYWQSTYSWGWAPFHYGRWYLHPRCGWVWLPDRVWGPAWVTWRVAGSNCGWAPLPPHAEFDIRLGWRFNGVTVGVGCDFGLGASAFAFVAFGDFCSHDLHRSCLPPAQVTTVYRQTTIVNNYTVVKNTVIHQGIPVERVSAVSRTPVPRATVRDLPAGSTGMAGRAGGVVYRAQPHAPARPVNMVAQKVDVRQPVIQHSPIVSSRTAQPSTYGSSGWTPASPPHRSTMETPKASPWPSNPKPGASSQTQSPPWAPASTHATPSTTTTTWSSEPRKQSTPSAPGNWRETGAPSGNNAHGAGQSASAASRQASAEGRNPHVYYPKGYYQASENRSRSSSEQSKSGPGESSGGSPETHGKKN